MKDSAYANWLELQKRYPLRPKNNHQKQCNHLRTYLTNTKMRDYPDGEWIALPVFKVCRDCWWPEPI